MTSLRVTTGAVTGKYIGLIEMSPRWIKDVTDRVVDFEITKETSSGSDDILPVGSVTANSLSLSMVVVSSQQRRCSSLFETKHEI